MTAFIGRREFITLLGGGAAAWPITAEAQQAERARRIGVLMYWTEDDPEGQARIAAFARAEGTGLGVGRNVRIDTLGRRQPSEFVKRGGIGRARAGRHPGRGGAIVAPLLQATRTVPIVFAQTPDPVGAGFVASLARPAAMPPVSQSSNTASAGNG